MNHESKSSLVWLLFAGYICLETFRNLPIGTWKDPGPGFWPLGAGLLLGGLSALVLIRALLEKSPAEKTPWYPPETWQRIAGVVLALLLYTVVFDFLGYLLATFLLIVFLFRIAEPRRWGVALSGSALIAMGSYGLFEKWLRTQLPKGLWGF